MRGRVRDLMGAHSNLENNKNEIIMAWESQLLGCNPVDYFVEANISKYLLKYICHIEHCSNNLLTKFS